MTRNRIARLNSDGTLDMAFNPNSTGTFGVMAIALQPDGKIIVGGDFNGFGITIGGAVAQLHRAARSRHRSG